MKKTLNCSGKLLDLSTPIVMGILNLTPDSFYDGGKNDKEKDYIHHTRKMLEAGAKIIDIGGQSSRPGATLLKADEEWERIGSAIEKLVKEFPETVFSVDTFYSTIVKKAIESGVSIVNDISGGEMDPEMFRTVSLLKVPYVLMHMQGTPATMQNNPQYENVTLEILDYFNLKVTQLRALGTTDIILDPGFGFGKTTNQNFNILKNLQLLGMAGLPILAGLSRKSMIGGILKSDSKHSLNGSTVLNTVALLHGATILRVHDVNEAHEAILLIEKLKSV